jgi:hypothetical protein
MSAQEPRRLQSARGVIKRLISECGSKDIYTITREEVEWAQAQLWLRPPPKVSEGDRLITIEEAHQITRRPHQTLHSWVRKGHLEEEGREPFRARGGGKILVSETRVRHLHENPPLRTGRPPKGS